MQKITKVSSFEIGNKVRIKQSKPVRSRSMWILGFPSTYTATVGFYMGKGVDKTIMEADVVLNILEHVGPRGGVRQ